MLKKCYEKTGKTLACVACKSGEISRIIMKINEITPRCVISGVHPQSFALLKTNALKAFEEESKRAGAYMRTGYGLIVNEENILGRVLCLEQLYKIFGVLKTARVSYAYNLLAGIYSVGIVFFRKSLNGSLASSDLAEGNYLANFVALEQGLDAEHGADDSGNIRYASAFAQMHEVINGENLIEAVAQGNDVVKGLLNGHTLCAAFGGTHCQQTLAKGGAVGVDEQNSAVGVAILELSGSDGGGIEGAAYARGHADKKNILALLEKGLKVVNKPLGVYLRGGNIGALGDHLVVTVVVEAFGVKTGVLLAVVKE